MATFAPSYEHICDKERDTFTETIHDTVLKINSVPTKRDDSRIDTKALNGLRGFVAIHIMLHHSFEFSKLEQNLLGSVQMPLFFLISGFVMALNYGKQNYLPTKCCTELQPDTESITDDNTHNLNLNRFNAKHFYQRRIARTMPLYYVTSFAALPLVYFGYSTFVSPGTFLYISIAFTIFAVPSWFGPFLLNPPSWFVSTIWFFYWIFPSLLPKLQQYIHHTKQTWIVAHYFLQLIIGLVVYITLQFVPFVSSFAFNIATMWPPTRISLFIMGILAGLLRNESIPIRASQIYFNVDDWKKKCNYLFVGLHVVFIPCIIIDRLSNNRTKCSLWLQLIIAWWQLQFIYALTMDQGTSLISRCLSSKWMLALGRISYSIYLVHFPLMGYICWCVYGTQHMPLCELNYNDHSAECNDEWHIYNDHRLMPLWCIPIHVCLSFIVAVALNRLVEEPMRGWLRP